MSFGKKGKGILALLLVLALTPLAFAQSATPSASPTVSAAASDVAGKLCGIVDFVQYVAGAVGVLYLGVLGVQFVTVGTNPQRRDELKSQMGLVVLGLFVVLISKSVVSLILPAANACIGQ